MSLIQKELSDNLMLLFILILFIGNACRPEKVTSPDVMLISGKIENPSGDKIYFYSYKDTASRYLGIKTAIDSSLIDGAGNYSLEFRANTPMVFDLETSDSILVTNLFLLPGDRVELNFIGKNNKPEISSEGIASRFNSFLIQYNDTFFREPSARKVYYILTNYMELQQFTEYCEDRKQKQFDFFHRFFKGDSLRKELSGYAGNTIVYGIGSDKLLYLWKKRMKGEPVFPDSSWFSFITPAFLENKDALFCPAYIRFLNLYIKDTYERHAGSGELTKQNPAAHLPVVEKYKLAGKLLKPPYRDVLWYNIIRGEMNEVAAYDGTAADQTITLDSMITWFNQRYRLNQ